MAGLLTIAAALQGPDFLFTKWGCGWGTVEWRREPWREAIGHLLPLFRRLPKAAIVVAARPRTEADVPRLREEVCEIARYCERVGMRFYVYPVNLRERPPSGRVMPPMPLDALEEIARAAPRAFQGFFVGEQYTSNTLPEMPEYYEGLLGLAARLGKRVVWTEHSKGIGVRMNAGWWAMALCDQPLFFRFVKPKFRRALVLSHETNCPHNEAANLGLVLGCWLSGIVDDFGVDHQPGWAIYEVTLVPGAFNFPPPDLTRRLYVMSASLGCTFFSSDDRAAVWDPVARSEGKWRPSEEFLALCEVADLIVKGKLLIPQREQLRSLSPIAIVYRRRPPEKLAFKGGILDPLPPDAPERWVGNWFRSPTGERFYGRILYGAERMCDTLIPKTPCGFVAIYPPGAEPVGARFVLETDGGRLWFEGREVPSDEVAPLLKRLRREARKLLPVRADGVFLSAADFGDFWQVVLIDPRIVGAGPLHVRLVVNLEGRWEALDALTGERLGEAEGGSSIPVAVPEGGFRILRLRRL